MSQNVQAPNFIMVVGLPGSGKSTYIEQNYPTYYIHSSDDIREELTGDVNNQDVNKKVFEILHKRVKEDLKQGKDVIYDATNISWKRRKGFLQELNKISCYKECILIATPYEICLERNYMRNRVVPNFVIERMYRNFDIPWYNEGWDNIKVVYTADTFKTFYGNPFDFIYDNLNYDQESKWHKCSLGVHSALTFLYVALKKWDLTKLNRNETIHAAALHDCGKLFVKSFKDSRGNDSDFAHYYNHENVGAYNSLFYEKAEEVDSLFVAALIRYHMILHFFKDWKASTKDKYEKEFCENEYLKKVAFYEALQILHEGDKIAH